MEVTLAQMLNARERRARLQRELISRYNLPLVSFTMNIPGPVKASEIITRGFDIGVALLKRGLEYYNFDVAYSSLEYDITGPQGFFAVDAEPLEIKKLTASVEDGSPLGRLFDMDVIRTDLTKVDRRDINLPGRKCLICENFAAACARSRTHDVPTLQNATNNILNDAIKGEEDYAKAAVYAVRALNFEVTCSPKPGLVDRFGTGSHRDMDIFTFLISSSVLYPYFEACCRIGRQTAFLPPEYTFNLLRRKGLKAEKEMFSATKGVNTHKGAIFSVGLICGALGRLNRGDWKNPALIMDEVRQLTADLMEKDFGNITEETAQTAGQKLYLSHGITGVRGQAAEGFPAVIQIGLPTLEKGLRRGYSYDRAGAAALLNMLCNFTDTNMIARSDIDTAKEMSLYIGEILKNEPYPTEQTLSELDRMFTDKNLSPGGCADLLAICFMLLFLKEEE